MPKIISLIIAGGEGVRLWPLSTPENPKPFIKLIGNKSFIRMAYERALAICPKKNIFISTLEKLKKRVIQELPEFPKGNLILEPMPKNTAPAIALAAMKLKKLGKDNVMVILPADHYIEPIAEFKRAIFTAAKKAKEGDFLMTFGIKPESPSTEYGYIEILKLRNIREIFKVKRFTEKPSSKRAVSFLKKNNYFWNSGMFVWRIDSILKAIQKHTPDIFQFICKIERNSKGKLTKAKLKREFSKLHPISIDYAVIEKADNCLMTELKALWRDFGSLLSIDEYFQRNKHGNILKGKVLSDKCHRSTLWAGEGQILAFGVDNIIAILDNGNLILLNKKKKHNLKKIRNQIKRIQTHGKI